MRNNVTSLDQFGSTGWRKSVSKDNAFGNPAFCSLPWTQQKSDEGKFVLDVTLVGLIIVLAWSVGITTGQRSAITNKLQQTTRWVSRGFQESAFDQKLRMKSGAVGVMQMKPSTSGAETLSDPSAGAQTGRPAESVRNEGVRQ